MKKFFRFFAIAAMAVAIVGCSDSDTPAIEPINPPAPEPLTPAKEATVTISAVEIGSTEATIEFISENAAEVKYVVNFDGSNVPDSKYVYNMGVSVDCGKSVVVINPLTPNTDYYIYAVAANSENKLTLSEVLQIKTLDTYDAIKLEAEEYFEQVTAEYGNYDVALVAEILCGKSWMIGAEVLYNDDWSQVRDVVYYSYNPNHVTWPGWSQITYTFTEGNRFEEYVPYEDETHIGYTCEGNWSFDAEAKMLILNFEKQTTQNGDVKNLDHSTSYRLTALRNERFVWDYMDSQMRREFIIATK